MRKRNWTSRVAAIAVLAVVTVACDGGDATDTTEGATPSTATTGAQATTTEGGTTDTTQATDTTSTSTPGRAAYDPDGDIGPTEQPGPNGESPADPSELELSDTDIQALQDGGYTVAFVDNGSNNVTDAIIRGLEERLGELGMELVATATGDFDPGVQMDALQSVLQLQPDVLISTPVDPSITASAYQEFVDAGIELVFVQDIPEGFQHQTDYAAVIGQDYVGAARTAASLVADAMGGLGKLAFIFYDVNFPFTNNWDAAFKYAISTDYPDIEVVSTGFADPATVDQTASAVFAQNPDIGGIYATWQDPLEAALSALRASNNAQDIPASAVGLNETIALALARGENVVGVGLDQPCQMGKALADTAGGAVLGNALPAYTALPSSEVTQENLADAYLNAYCIEVSDDIKEALNG